MRRSSVFICAVMFITSISFGQPRLSLFAGYGFSQFEEEAIAFTKLDQAGYIPVGANVEFGRNMFTFGAELVYSVLPFNFDLKRDGVGKVGEVEITQFIFGGFVKIRFGDRRDINPFIRAGIGYYTGNAKSSFNQGFSNNSQFENSKIDLKGAVGFNGGIGLEFPLSTDNFFFVEAIYHFVEREADTENSSSFRANNFAFQAGITFIF